MASTLFLVVTACSIMAYLCEISIDGDQFLEEGDTLKLVCSATGNDLPPDGIEWFRSNEKVKHNERIKIEYSVDLSKRRLVSTLSITGVTTEDAGTYVCRSKDQQFESIKVTVLKTYPVTVSISPKTVPVYFMQGKPLTLTCTVRGNINADVNWVKDEVPLDGAEYQIESSNDEDEQGPKKNVKITKASAGPLDAALFRCYSFRMDDTIQTAEFSMFVRDANITEGSDATLTCRPDLPYPFKTVTWYKEGTPLEEIPDLKGRLEIGNDTVVFHDTKLTDSGVYTCRLELWTVNKELVQVFEEKVELQGKPFIANQSNPELNKQVTILLKCPTEGYPPPAVFWFKEGKVIEASDHILLTSLNGQSSGNLEISNATEADYGRYRCTAENALGTASFTFDLTGPGAGNSGFKAMLGLVDVFGLFVGISIASLALP